MQHIALIDNYDSFTHLLQYYICNEENVTVHIMRNNEINYELLDTCHKIILSPGAGLPSTAGDILKIIDIYHKQKPILGICLGHQALAEYFGGTLYNLPQVIHGEANEIKVTVPNCKLFTNIPIHYTVGRYHSWAVNIDEVNCLTSIAKSGTDNAIMALEHTTLPIVGVQFHPESVLSEYGQTLLGNFIHMY
ncbi:MAG: aminodeoxychorismate/anthranilate synthase component II [Bacteroidia bacterium]|nr:aminodeoxychorismate/anthranilate synthase component II [Bacteroidia bacterium]